MADKRVSIFKPCPHCKKECWHDPITKIWTGRYGHKEMTGKEYPAGYKCTLCSAEWDNL